MEEARDDEGEEWLFFFVCKDATERKVLIPREPQAPFGERLPFIKTTTKLFDCIPPAS